MSSLTSVLCGASTPVQISEIVLSIVGLTCSTIVLILGSRGFAAMQREGMEIPFLFRYMFYSCISMGFIQYALILTNSFYCSPFNILISFVFYSIIAIHLFISWLSRLYFTFQKSIYEKSNQFYVITITLFIVFIFTAIAGIILFTLDIPRFPAVSLLIVAAFGYMSMSIWLMLVYARQLLTLISNKIITVRFRTQNTLRQKTETLDLSYNDHELVDCISRYLTLGICSLLTTFCILGFASFDFIATQTGYHWKTDSDPISVLHTLIILVMADVFVNNLCVYLQFRFARNFYTICCKCMNRSINGNVEKMALRRLRAKTFTFYASQFQQTQRKRKALKMKIDVDAPSVGMDPNNIPTFSAAQVQIPTLSPIGSSSEAIPEEVSPKRTSEIDGDETGEQDDAVMELEKADTGHSKNHSSLDFDSLINLEHLTIKRVSSTAGANDSVHLEIVNDPGVLEIVNEQKQSAVESEIVDNPAGQVDAAPP